MAGQRLRNWLGVGLIVALGVACGASDMPTATPTMERDPLLDELLRETATPLKETMGQRRAAPEYWPTFPDYNAVLVQTDFSGYSALVRTSLERRFHDYAVTYAVKSCLVGQQMTLKGFWAHMDRVGGVPDEEARRLVGVLLAMRDEDVSSSCVRPLLWPDTGNEARFGTALCSAAVMARIGGSFRGLVQDIIDNAGARWFSEKGRGDYLSAACDPWIAGEWHLSEGQEFIPRAVSQAPPHLSQLDGLAMLLLELQLVALLQRSVQAAMR